METSNGMRWMREAITWLGCGRCRYIVGQYFVLPAYSTFAAAWSVCFLYLLCQSTAKIRLSVTGEKIGRGGERERERKEKECLRGACVC